MWYVYVIRSVRNPDFIYIGYTNNIDLRLQQHNLGRSPSTKTHAPYEIEFYMVFKSENQAKNIEAYFKTGSGKAILKKRFLGSN
jgi:putative endonuclease